MRPSRTAVVVGVLIAAALASVIFTSLNGGPGNHFAIGLLLGTSWGLTTLAAAWFALGPGPFAWRGIGSVAWCIAIVGAFGLSVLLTRGAHEEIVMTMGICVTAQWILLQIPLWIVGGGFGFQLRRDYSSVAAGRLQFGMRHLMIFTALVGVVLGLGRMLVAAISVSSFRGETPIFAILTLAAVITTLPLVLAFFIRSYFAPAALIALAFIALIVPAQLQLLIALKTPGPDLYHLIWINVFQAGWICAIAAAVRLGGYRLERAR